MNLVNSVLAGLIFSISLSASASQTCTQSVQNDLNAIVSHDFPGETLDILIPEISDSASQVLTYSVPVYHNETLRATYDIMVDETCHLIGYRRNN